METFLPENRSCAECDRFSIPLLEKITLYEKTIENLTSDTPGCRFLGKEMARFLLSSNLTFRRLLLTGERKCSIGGSCQGISDCVRLREFTPFFPDSQNSSK